MSNHEIFGPEHARGRLTERENHLIDEARRGGLSRREFLAAASVAGMGLSLAGLFAGSADAATKKKKAASTGGRKPLLRLSGIAPGSKLEPVVINNGGALLHLGLAGEYLCHSNNTGVLEPRVAESWKSNADSTVWTFKIRKGIKFHNSGKTLTAADVVATFDLHADPANKGNALSVFKGFLEKGGTTKVDDYTVQFNLKAPVGGWPYLVSSTNYNCIILPAGYAGDWEQSFEGCGPWIKEKYVVDQGVTYRRNPTYWDKTRQPNFEKLQVLQYKDDGARLAALQSGQIDWDSFASATTAKTLQNDANFTVQQTPSNGHLQLHISADRGPFAADKRLRQALLLTLDRPGIVAGVLNGFGLQGNDSPMTPGMPTTDKTVAQRKKDVAQAKSLMAAAGKPNGFDVTLTTWGRADITLLAQIVQQSAKDIGINVKIDIADSDGSAYYDDKRDPSWLKSDFGITEYGHRDVANVYLNAAVKTGGVWNAAHYSNKEVDAQIASYIGSSDLTVQKAASKKIQELMLDDSPIGFTFFANTLDVAKKGLSNYYTNGMNVIETSRAKMG